MSVEAVAYGGSAFSFGPSFLSGIEPSERARLQPLLERVSLPHRAVLTTAAEPLAAIWIPDGAIVSAVVRLSDGETVEAGLIGSEGIVGLSAFLGTDGAALTTIVQVAGALWRLPIAALVDHLDEFPSLERQALRYAGSFLAAVAQVAACNATHSLRQRMARWLLSAHDRAGRDRFRLTHEFIATMINVRRAGVSQFANDLRAAGAIAYTRGEVQVLNRDALERESCECYEAVRRLNSAA
jgi:CRP-like cAMP-binding protein